MDKFLVAAPPPAGGDPETSRPPRRWHRWSRIAVELDGRIDARFRHRELRRLLDSYAETRTFEHKYYRHGEERCPTYVNHMINASNFGEYYHPAREGVSAMEFDKKGVYLASVTMSGCLTVHDFETLYCSLYGPLCSLPDDSSNYVLHISNQMPLCAVRWNPENQDEIVCSSSQSDKVFLFDIGYVSSVPTEVLQKGKTKFHALSSESRKGLTDLAFTSDDKSRLFASGLDGAVYMWDRRLSKTHCVELTALPESQFTSVELNMDNRTVFGATRNGTVHAWDTRGGRASAAFQSHNEGVYLASVTMSGCLTVHDFETLYCSLYGPLCSLPDDSSNYVLHISNQMPLCAVRWNPENQDEIVCSSSQSDKVFLFDIGYVSSVPTEVLQKGKTKFHALSSESRKGLTDLAFTSDDKSRLFASGLDGAVYMWDRRLSKTHCVELTALPESQFTSVELNMDNRTVFGATRNGTVHAWDTRGGRASAAFQSHNEVQPLSSVKISTLLGKIASLKKQSNIVSSEVLSIDFNPSCSYQLAFHLDDGWSGVLNVNTLSVSHLHCPPPAWLEGVDSVLHKRKATWLSTSSIYAVGSSCSNGMYVLDFHPHTSSACHVDYNEETRGSEENQPAENKFIPLSERVLSCAAHPLSHNIIAGTEFSSLLMISQKYETMRNPE